MHKYTRLVRGQDGMDVKIMIYPVLLKKDMLCNVQNMPVVRGMGRGLSDQHVVSFNSGLRTMD